MLATLIIVLIILAIGGIWGVATTLYIESFEEPFVNPLLRFITKQGAIGGAIYLVVCTFFMCVHRAISFAPAWGGLYLMMSIAGYPTDKIHSTLYFFILCAGIIKMSAVTRDEYYPDSKYFDKPTTNSFEDRIKNLPNTDSLFEKKR